jgi:predicted AlkP superfamily pyrophosphatase or phosphodiesterase
MKVALPPRRGSCDGSIRRGAGRVFSAILLAALAACALSSCAALRGTSPSSGRLHGVRLVLQITVDQFRGDFVAATRDRWGEGGLRRLYEHGAVFDDAHHRHANTETVVGHATLATGADPSVHGMVGNAWFDREGGRLQYNVEDARYDAVGHDLVQGSSAAHPEVTKKTGGRSPEALLAPTLADSIAKAGGGRAKVFAVSLKDRSSVPMAGRLGKALWWSDATGEFLSSSYYYPGRALPEWVQAWNAGHPADRFDGSPWTLLHDRRSYRAGSADDVPWEAPLPTTGRTFPHRLDRRALGASYYAAIASSPFGDELLLDFARTLLEAEDVGRDDVLDYVAVGFSAVDYIGHRFGPSSLEMEDAILRIDRTIAALLAAADEVAGLGRTLVVLSSDHGVAEAPEELLARGREGGRIRLSEVEETPAVRDLVARLGGKVVLRRWPPYVYLDHEALLARGVDPEAAAKDLAAEIAKAPGVEAVFTRGAILAGELPDTEVARAVRRSFQPDRSGDLHVVPKPGWQIAYEGERPAPFVTGHGTPWNFDTFVPLVISGPGVPHVEVSRRVETVDVAPTVAALLGVERPAGATGKVLGEALPSSR